MLAEALESVTTQRSASLVLVNPAFTSQVSSLTRRLEGRREGDRFIAPCGRNGSRLALFRPVVLHCAIAGCFVPRTFYAKFLRPTPTHRSARVAT